MSYNRTISPGGRRIINPARASEPNFDPYQSQRHNSYVSPRSSNDRVIPISTQTFVNIPSNTSTTARSTTTGYDSYSGRPRRSSLIDQQRSAPNPAHISRSRPTIIQGSDIPRLPSPSRRDRDYYITPASSRDPKESRKFEHKMIYSVDDGSAKLVADLEVPAIGGADGRHHRRRDSAERVNHKNSDRARRTYQALNRRDKSIDDEDAFSYTDAAGMFRETQPSWRERDTRPRRNSLDRSGVSRERPVSVLDPYGQDPRRSAREIGPPPSQRGWDKINDNLGRSRSTRDAGPRDAPRSPSRGRGEDPRASHGDARDPYQSIPRRESVDRNRPPAVHQERVVDRYEPHEYDDRREPRHHERRWSASRPADRSVSRRGFGLRSDSKDRFGPRGSDESLEARKRDLARDSGYAEPHRRDTAPDQEFIEQARRKHAEQDWLPPVDRVPPERPQLDERDRHHERRRDLERHYVDHERDSDRERRPRDRESDRDRHPPRRDADQDRDYDRGSSSNAGGISSAAKVAAGGLAGAAALYGLSKDRNKDKEPERERDRDREQTLEPRRDPDPDRRQKSHSDDAAHDRDRYHDSDRGLGFAFEAPSEVPKPRPVPPQQPIVERDRVADRTADREFERTHEDIPPKLMANAPVDPDEDYRRRIEQAQRELGIAPDERHGSDSDPDRERRRREREARMQGRQDRYLNGDALSGAYPSADQSPLRRSFENPPPESSIGSVQSIPGELKRRPSIIDRPMPDEPTAQIIDNSLSEKRENRVRIVDPPTDEEERRPKGILKKPTQKFPEDRNAMREGVAPLKDASKKGIPPGARWTKIDRRLVNPEALEDAKERYEERLDCVIVLRVLTKEEIQKLADRTRELRDKRFEQEERAERRAARRRDRERDRRDHDEYSDDSLEDWERDEKKSVRMLEAPPVAADFTERREREGSYAVPPRASRE